jgi:hypothetical protein
MSGKKFPKLANRKAIIGLAVPVAVCVASSFFNLKPVFQQALVGIMILWFYLGLMTGFGFWS